MRILDNNLYLSWAELQGYGIQESTLKKNTHLARVSNGYEWTNILDPEDGRRNLVLYDSIPIELRLKQCLPAKELLLKQVQNDQLTALLRLDQKAYSFYYTTPDSEYASDLQEQAAWMMLLVISNRQQAKMLGYKTLDDLYTAAMEVMIRRSCDTKRPLRRWSITNLRRFKSKIQPFYAYLRQAPEEFDKQSPTYYLSTAELSPAYTEALASLVSKRYGKSNAAKLATSTSEEQQALLVHLYSQPVKLTMTQVYSAYIRTAVEKHIEYKNSNGSSGWPEKSLFTLQTCKNFLRRPDIRQLCYMARHGKKHYHNEYTLITRRAEASRANAKWVIDGTPIHMYFMMAGKAYQRLYIFTVIDEHSMAIIGYSIGTSESADDVLRALRDACTRTGYMPHEIQSDNSSAIKSHHVQEAISHISLVYRPAEAGNARSKKIEPMYRHLNERILKLKPGYMGNPHASLDYQPNMEHMVQQVKSGQLPTYEQAYNLLDESLNEWNAHVFNQARPLEKYNNSLKASQADQRRFTAEIDMQAFWVQPGKMALIADTRSGRTIKRSTWKPTEYTYTNRGIEVIIDGEKHWYLVADTSWNAQRIGAKFCLRIEPTYKDKAILIQDNKPVIWQGSLLIASQTDRMPSAALDFRTGDHERLRATLDAKKQQQKTVQQKLDRYLHIAESTGLVQPIDTSYIHGKEISHAANVQLNEQLLNTRLSTAEEEMEPAEEVIHNPTIRRF